MIYRDDAEDFATFAKFMGIELEKSDLKGELYRGMLGDRLLVVRETSGEMLEIFCGNKEKKRELLSAFMQYKYKENENESETD